MTVGFWFAFTFGAAVGALCVMVTTAIFRYLSPSQK